VVKADMALMSIGMWSPDTGVSSGCRALCR